MYQYTACPVCGKDKFDHFLKCKDHLVTGEEFAIVTCAECALKFTNPIPDTDNLSKYYESKDYISHSEEGTGMISSLYFTVRSIALKSKLNLIHRYVSRGTILDYGCGTGAFLETCRRADWIVSGIEPDAGARQIALNRGLKVSAAAKDLDPASRFDIITLWHVLEHIFDLNEAMKFFSRSLNKNGRLIIAVPNHKSHDAEYYGAYWAAYDVPRHLYHFDQNSLSKLMQRYGFDLEVTRAMKFDSYYVSLLSEKYKYGKQRYLAAAWRGFVSNLKARSSGNHSSLIYIFKKL